MGGIYNRVDAYFWNERLNWYGKISSWFWNESSYVGFIRFEWSVFLKGHQEKGDNLNSTFSPWIWLWPFWLVVIFPMDRNSYDELWLFSWIVIFLISHKSICIRFIWYTAKLITNIFILSWEKVIYTINVKFVKDTHRNFVISTIFLNNF